ncbi:uncharacterized protein C5orf47 homolog [Melanerpes formicivorus]|uniref:uncharacterized protein C5orf47 homolog n=1 Tax=Melanerpes formicivorus TaxID=211600 RepID=UPI00358EF9D5
MNKTFNSVFLLNLIFKLAVAAGCHRTAEWEGLEGASRDRRVQPHCGGDLRETKADTFDFPFPSRNVDKVIKRKKQKSKVWFKVWKVIAKMTEENEKFRRRLLACSQLNGEGNGRNQSSQNEVSCLDRESSLFGWAARK